MTAGTRSSTDVSARSFSRIDTVRVGNLRLLDVGEPVGFAGAIDVMVRSWLAVSDRLPAVGQIVAGGQLHGADLDGAKRRGDRDGA